jgi:hypothetical protein
MHCERYPKHKLDRVKLLKELRAVVVHASAGNQPPVIISPSLLNEKLRDNHFGYFFIAFWC